MFQRSNKLIIYTTGLVALLLLTACTSAPSGTEIPIPTITPTLVPTATDVPTLQASITPDPPTVTPTATLPTTFVAPVTGERLIPPIDISLPSSWRQGFDAMVIADLDALRAIPVAVYSGPVTGGTGYIVLFWNFPIRGNASDVDSIDQIMWTEGLRLFRLAVVEQGCNPGTDLKMDFMVGEKPASGANFSIVGCPESKDARGWFAALRELGMNFAFYAYVEPIADINSPEALQQVPIAWQELQQILNTVQFHVEDLLTVTPTP